MIPSTAHMGRVFNKKCVLHSNFSKNLLTMKKIVLYWLCANPTALKIINKDMKNDITSKQMMKQFKSIFDRVFSQIDCDCECCKCGDDSNNDCNNKVFHKGDKVKVSFDEPVKSYNGEKPKEFYTVISDEEDGFVLLDSCFVFKDGTVTNIVDTNDLVHYVEDKDDESDEVFNAVWSINDTNLTLNSDKPLTKEVINDIEKLFLKHFGQN